MPDRSSRRASNATRPEGRIRPSSVSAATRAMFTALQMLRARRGVNRIMYASASMLLRSPSIQPKQSASSTDSGHVMLGLPDAFL